MRSPAGYLVADAYLTRAGVFEYRDARGNVVRELRHHDDVFAEDSLASLALVPVTDLHPNEPVNASNARKVQAGSVGEVITRDGDYVRARVAITDAQLIEAALAGRQEVSCGYSCDVIPEVGEYNGEKYDARQINIRYDHLAIVPVGRAGRAVRLRLDGMHQITADGDVEPTQEAQMQKITVNGQEFEVSPEAAQAFEAELAKVKALGEEAAKLADSANGKADALEAEVKTLKAKHADAIDPAKLREAIKARVALEKQAEKFIGADKLDAMSDVEIKRAVISNVQPEFKLDDASESYVDGAFSLIVKAAESKNDSLDKLLQSVTPPVAVKTDAESARDEMIKRNSNAVAEYRKRMGAR